MSTESMWKETSVLVAKINDGDESIVWGRPYHPRVNPPYSCLGSPDKHILCS